MSAPKKYHGEGGGAVYVDALEIRVKTPGWRFGSSCHLFCLPGYEDDLHAFAARLDLKRHWFQEAATLPHYDLSAYRHELALLAGAHEANEDLVADIVARWKREKEKRMEIALRGQSMMPGGEVRNDRPWPSAANRILSESEALAEFARAKAELAKR